MIKGLNWKLGASTFLSLFLLCSANQQLVLAASGDPIKIGFITSLTGAGANQGKIMVNGAQLYLDEIGNTMGGRPVQLIVENDDTAPATGVEKAKKLINENKVNILSGLYFAHIFYAVAPVVEKAQIPMVDCVSGADDITQRKRSKWVIRTSWSSSQPSHPFGEYVAKTLHYKRVVTIASDYPYGYECVGGFQQSFEKAGGQVVQKLWTALGLKDFSSTMKQIDPKADAIFICIVGQSSNIVPKQLKELGPKLPLIGATTSFEETVLARIGSSMDGAISCNPWSLALNTPANNKFVAAYRRQNLSDPNWSAECGYTNMMWIKKAVDSIGGRVEDKEALMAALRRVQLKDAPRGPIKLDSYGNPVDNIYIRKVEMKNGKYQNSVIFTYPMVSQFWSWKPEEYLKQPPYTKTFPPCTYCRAK